VFLLLLLLALRHIPRYDREALTAVVEQPPDVDEPLLLPMIKSIDVDRVQIRCRGRLRQLVILIVFVVAVVAVSLPAVGVVLFGDVQLDGVVGHRGCRQTVEAVP
jgi:hypothetical protein